MISSQKKSKFLFLNLVIELSFLQKRKKKFEFTRTFDELLKNSFASHIETKKIAKNIVDVKIQN